MAPQFLEKKRDLIEKLKEQLVSTLQWTVTTCLAQGGGRKKRFSILLESSFIQQILVFPSNSRILRKNVVDPSLQDKILLPDDFAEYIHHIGNACEMHSIIQSGLIPGGTSNRKDRQSVFFTAVNPIFNLIKEKLNTDKPRVAPYKHTWRAHHNTVFRCNFKACSETGIAILSNSIACGYSFRHTTSDLLSIKWFCMKTTEELVCIIYKSPRLPRVTLVPKLATLSEGCTCFRIEKNPMTVRKKSSSAHGDLWQ